MTVPDRFRPRLAVLLALAGLAASCAPSIPSHDPGALRLDSLAAREANRHRAVSVSNVPVPPGIPDALLAPTPLGPTARTPLDEALRLAAERDVDLPEAPPARTLTTATQINATRLYAQARSASLEGRTSEAADLYTKVVEIDPSAGEAWSALAALRAAQGDAPGATEAWRSALANNPTNPRALDQLGLAALRRADLAEALTLLARARLNNPDAADPALPYLLDAALADAFEQSGALRAAAESAEAAASAPTPFEKPTSEQRRLLALLRQRALLLRGAGDMHLRLGDMTAASRDYLDALDVDDLLDAGTAARAIYALRSLGADAAAARVLVRELERSEGRIDALHIRLVEHLSTNLPSEVARALAEALPGVPERGQWEPTPASRSAAARLDAAGQPTPDRAASILLAYLAGVDSDDAATEQLARTLAEAPRILADSLVQLVAHNPTRVGQFTALFARAAHDRAGFESAIAATPASTPSTEPATGTDLTLAQARALVRGWLALRTGADDRALALFTTISSDPNAAPYAKFGLIEALFELGRLQQAFDAADALAAERDPRSRLLAGIANTQLQRHDEAFALLRTLIQDNSIPERDHTEALLFAARAAAASAQTDPAQRFLREAMERSPLREDSYAGLIQIAFAEGAQRNQAQLADVVRRLRENIPTSRTLRLLQARELATQGQTSAASEILIDLLALDPRDEAAQEQYVATIVGAGQTATAEAWLRERLDSDIAEPSTVVLLARVLTSTDRAAEAERILTQSTTRFPRSDEIRREREAVLRTALKDPVAADQLALERLNAAPPTLDNTLELAEAQARLSLWEDAATSVERALSQPGVALRRDQKERLARAVGLFAASADALDQSTSRLIADAAGMLAEDAGGAPDALHRARVALLVHAEAPVSEIIDASEIPSSANRDLALQLRLGAIDLMRDRNELDRAFQLAREGVRVNNAVAPEMLTARLSLAAQFDRPQEAIDAVREAVAADKVAPTYQTLARIFRAEPTDPSPAELAYLAGQFFGATGKDASANQLYELTLELNPNQPWAANNLGYGLVERGDDVLRAYELIQRAFTQLPDEMAIVDSMGWARYRVGIFEDAANAEGAPIEGAVTLLRLAASHGVQPGDYLVHDHLGDALWRAGDHDGALASWRRSDQLLLTLIQQAEAQDKPSPELLAFVKTLRATRETLARKVEAASRENAEPRTQDVFLNLRDEALKIPIPPIAPARNDEPAA